MNIGERKVIDMALYSNIDGRIRCAEARKDKKILCIIVLSILLFRCLVDITFPGEKPLITVIAFVGSIMLVSLFLLVAEERPLNEILLIVSTSIACLFSLLIAPYEIGAQLGFYSQCLLPVMFLLIISRSRRVDFDWVRTRFLKLGTPIIIVGVGWAFVDSQYSGSDALLFTGQNAVQHPTAQLLAKAALAFIEPTATRTYIASAIPVLTILSLLALNVRSALIGYVLALASTSKKMAMTFIFLASLAIIYVRMFGSGIFGELYDRMLYKNHAFLGDSLGNITSGRADYIWPYYIELMFESTPIKALFGNGAVWTFTSMRLYAHNDLLTIPVCYGVIGSGLFFTCWIMVLIRIADPFRIPCILLFSVLLFTNGVVTYQSNIIFVIYFSRILSNPKEHSKAAL